MPHRRWLDRLADILDAANLLGKFTAGMDRDAFAADLRTQAAVQLQILIIGEAASHVPDAIAARHPSVPWSRLRAMRNVIAHHYFGIDVDLVWQTATKSAQALAEQIRTVIDAETPSDP